MRRVRLAVVGAGARGSGYAQWTLEHPDRAELVAVADPRGEVRDRIGDEHHLPADARFGDWRDLLDEVAAERLALDGVVICTQDRDHHDPAVAFANAHIDILLEKPISPTEQEVREVVEAVQRGGVAFVVAHVLRYTPYAQALRTIVQSGRLGKITSIEHLEPVGYWHFAHSYVRGNWSRVEDSSSLLMAKSSHDIDWLRYIIGKPFSRVSSFGSLTYFTPENAPEGAGTRCVDCAAEADCIFSALKIYLPRVGEFPASVITTDQTPEGVAAAIETGPYGRCVYYCDNDVPDHQVVAMEFADGTTGTFTLAGLSIRTNRHTRIFGSAATLVGNGETYTITDFATGLAETFDPFAGQDVGHHGGGDDAVMDAFVTAIETGDPSTIASGPAESLETHLAVFAAERARLTGSVEYVEPVAS